MEEFLTMNAVLDFSFVLVLTMYCLSFIDLREGSSINMPEQNKMFSPPTLSPPPPPPPPEEY